MRHEDKIAAATTAAATASKLAKLTEAKLLGEADEKLAAALTKQAAQVRGRYPQSYPLIVTRQL